MMPSIPHPMIAPMITITIKQIAIPLIILIPPEVIDRRCHNNHDDRENCDHDNHYQYKPRHDADY